MQIVSKSFFWGVQVEKICNEEGYFNSYSFLFFSLVESVFLSQAFLFQAKVKMIINAPRGVYFSVWPP